MSEQLQLRDESQLALHGLTLVVPIYNEKDSVERLSERLEKVCGGMTDPHEILLVDDGSNDGTSEVLQAMDLPNVRVLTHTINRGYGSALKTGVRAAQYPWIAITDADETYPDERIPELYQLACDQSIEMVVGARVGADAKIPLIRRFPKFVLGVLANWLSGFKIPDINSGLRIMRKEVVKRYLRILPDGFSFTTTITLAMLSAGNRVEYVPISYANRSGSSKIRPIYDTLNFLQLICRAVLWYNPLRVFIPLCLFFFLAAVGLVGVCMGYFR
jgi:glycosyltransferase involved in cell wall biosynthesis